MTAVRRLAVVVWMAAIATAPNGWLEAGEAAPRNATTAQQGQHQKAEAEPSSRAIAQSDATVRTAVTETGTTRRSDLAKTPVVAADTDKDASDPRAIHLSLRDAIAATIEHNLGIQVQHLDYTTSVFAVEGAYGIFDPQLTGTILESSNKSPTTSPVFASSSRSLQANFGIQETLPTGGVISGSFQNARQTQAGGFTSVSPAYTSGLGFNVDQPLLRNFGIDITRRNIDIARANLGISEETLRGVLINTALSVQDAYLDLVFYRQEIEVVKQALFLARDQARITQIRIDVGASAPLDILQPRVQTATQEENLIAAVANVRNAEDQLRQLLHLDPADWNRPLIPTDAVKYTAFTPDPAASVTTAFQLRPELREAAYGTEIRRINYLFARNQELPAVDLVASYRAAGLGGTVFGTDPTTNQRLIVSQTGYTHSLSQVFANDYPSWTFGVNLQVPLFNIAARANAKQAELQLDAQKVTTEQTKENILLDVRRAIRNIDTTAREISATKTSRESAEANVDAARKRYENGMMTNFDVLQIQQQLTDARTRELQALVAYEKSVVDYHRAVGDLLVTDQITLQQEHPDVLDFFGGLNRCRRLNYCSHVSGDPSLNISKTVVTSNGTVQ